jgi:glycosyltransferase involved in cell wall biosynthesis
MTTIPNISVIIPSNHEHHDLLKIVMAVCSQTVKPFEVVIVDSSVEGGTCPTEISDLCKARGIGLHYEYRAHTLPGHARNIGYGIASSELIAFIDVQTIPRPYWLEASLNLLLEDCVTGVFGGTAFVAKTSFERLVRDAFFGILPRKTLPGSVFRREVFYKAGQFIDWVRAGEDTEWMLRVDLLNIEVNYPTATLIDYVGLIGLDVKIFLKKWHRNYTASHDLPHLFPQKLFLWLVLYPAIIFIAFNWNYLIAKWSMESPFYIGHVTKFAAIFPPSVYVFVRGILLPSKRGVGFSRLFPIRFIAIALISFMADAVKAFVFTMPKLKDDAISK